METAVMTSDVGTSSDDGEGEVKRSIVIDCDALRATPEGEMNDPGRVSTLLKIEKELRNFPPNSSEAYNALSVLTQIMNAVQKEKAGRLGWTGEMVRAFPVTFKVGNLSKNSSKAKILKTIWNKRDSTTRIRREEVNLFLDFS